MSLMSLTAVELGRKIKEKEVTVEEAVTAALDAIEKREAQVHSFVTVDREGALKRAKEVQAKIDAGELTGPLAGVPVAIKDNMCTKGLLTTCSSKILYNFVPTYTAEAVLNLEKAGAVILGKTPGPFTSFTCAITAHLPACQNRRRPGSGCCKLPDRSCLS